MKIRLKEILLNPFTLLLAVWGILNLVQARFTPLNNDEAYYWMYSNHLAWGYFDHPPMIALMIRLGYLVFHNELGVRVVVVLSQLAALGAVWMLVDKDQRTKKESVWLFFMLAAILPVLNIYGFMATPDSPLILFSAIFLLIYKRFLNDESWLNTLLLGLTSAALMYSKYHGGILIFLIILSNPRLLKSYRFYLAGILAVVLFLPHLSWQYSNGFPSLKYHLVERISGFNPAHVPEFLASQFFFQNPFVLVVLIAIIIKVRTRNLFDRALYFIITGFMIFFFISSFRYRVEPQWTAVVTIPLIIILINNADFKPWIRGYFKWVAFILFPLFLLARLASMIDFLPVQFIKHEFHQKKQWARDISSLAGERPVVFTNSYQQPSVYTFYTGKFATTLDNLSYRKTQFDIWDFEEKLHGREVLYVPHVYNDSYLQYLTKIVFPDKDSAFVKDFKDFQSLQKECVLLKKEVYTFSNTGLDSIQLTIFNPYPYPIEFRHPELPVQFQIAFLKNGVIILDKDLDLPDNISGMKPGDSIQVDCNFTIEGLPEGKYVLAICSKTGILYDTFSSKLKTAIIRK
jgi:Dolichyl-phosphate-mannose-protein mannosyltransferase